MLKQLFNLVAPIAICGGADCTFNAKGKEAWAKVTAIDDSIWQQHHCPAPPRNEDMDWDDPDDFDLIYTSFARDAYDALFEQIVAEHGPKTLEAGHDYWGAKGFKLPHQSNKQFEIAGDTCGFYPWYETADLLIARLNSIGESNGKTQG